MKKMQIFDALRSIQVRLARLPIVEGMVPEISLVPALLKIISCERM